MMLPGDLPEVVARTPLGGGQIADTVSARLADGREVVIKQTPYDAFIEVDGLEALGAAGARVPRVLAADSSTLVLEKVGGVPEWERFGAELADLHRETSKAFGWHRDNLLGRVVQHNAPLTAWPEFFAERRLRPLLRASALPERVRDRLSAALEGPLPKLIAHDPPPSLLHGDLWGGNVVAGRWLIDPAVSYGDRELDLAFAALFGGFPSAMWNAYERSWPLAVGWRERRPALQLYHLLIHVAHFGDSYVPPVVARLDELGW